MMRMKLLLMVVVALTTMMSTLHAAGLVVRPDKKEDDYDEPVDLSHINPVDLCLFICHSCFQEVGINRIMLCSFCPCLCDAMLCSAIIRRSQHSEECHVDTHR